MSDFQCLRPSSIKNDKSPELERKIEFDYEAFIICKRERKIYKIAVSKPLIGSWRTANFMLEDCFDERNIKKSFIQYKNKINGWSCRMKEILLQMNSTTKQQNRQILSLHLFSHFDLIKTHEGLPPPFGPLERTPCLISIWNNSWVQWSVVEVLTKFQ